MNEIHKTPRTETRTLSKDIHNLVRNPNTHRAAAALGIVASIAVGTYGCASLSSESQRGSTYEGPVDSRISAINLDNGATIRSEPKMDSTQDFTNRLDTLELGDGKSIRVPTPNGVYVEDDNNGTWYGIPAAELTDVANVNISNDRDGIVWINEQKATPDDEAH